MKRLLSVTVLLFAALLTACGDDGPSTAEASTTAADGGGSGGPVTIDHRYGSTTLESTPERIVSVDSQWTDVLTELDAPLVAAVLDPVAEDGRFPWQEVPDDVDPIEATDSIPYEAIAAQAPDLIVVTYFATDEATYDRLSEIAPTIPLLGDQEVDPWEDIAVAAGEILGVSEQAEAMIAAVEQLTADLREELPGLEGKTYTLANYVPGDAIHVIANPDDGAGRLFGQLGMEVDPDLLNLPGAESGRVQLSLERIDELDSDLLIMLTNGADTAEIPGFANLPAVKSGAVAVLDTETITGLNAPSPLSIPFALDAIRPALEAAAG